MGNWLSEAIKNIGSQTVGKTLSKATQEEQDQLNQIAMMEAMKGQHADIPTAAMIQALHSGDEVTNYLKQNSMAEQLPTPFSYDGANYDWALQGDSLPVANDWVGQQYSTLFGKKPGKYKPTRRA